VGLSIQSLCFIGMFLYARLVLDNIESQSNLDHVRNEARNLPDGLNEALVDLPIYVATVYIYFA
jgi:hypothetical protein